MENQEGIKEGIEVAWLQEVVLVYRSRFRIRGVHAVISGYIW
jgi:hypothetical protein